MRRTILVGLIVVVLISVGIYKVNPQVSGSKTVQEIYQDVFDKSNGRLMTTANVGAQGANAGLSEQEILQAVYDADNHYLRTSSTGESGSGTNNWADLIGGTSTNDAFVIGNGSSITPSGTGIIEATIAQTAKAALEGCSLGQYAHQWTNQAWKMTCAQVQFNQLGGVATDAQIPHLNTLSTGLTASRCVQTDASGLLSSTAEACGTGSGTGTGVTDGDKGDITVTATGATWTVDANTITYAKMADIPTTTIVGRNTAGTGDPESLSIATVKTMLALTKADVGLSNVDNKSSTTLHTETRTESGALNIPRELAQADTTPIVIDPFYQRIVIAQLSQTTTFGVPTGTAPVDGQVIEIDAFSTVARTVSFLTDANGFCTGHDISLPTTTVAGKYVKWAFEWKDATDCWSFFGTTQAGSGSGSGGVTDAQYWLSTPHGSLTIARNIGGLSTGLLCHTVAAGVSTPATCTPGTDYQVPLPTVTNDAQLKRAAGDFATFAEKAVPVAADIILIEDSEAAGAKKKATVGTIRSGIGTIQIGIGSYYMPFGANPAALDASGDILELKFDNVIRECAQWQLRMNADYVSGLTLKAPYKTSATTGSFHLDVRMRVFTTDSGVAFASEAWGSNNDCNDTAVPGTTTSPGEISCALANTDTVTAGKGFQIEICRDIANDDAGAKVSLTFPVLEYSK